MRRWLSALKKTFTPGQWTRPAKRRRPITLAPAPVLVAPMRPVSVRTQSASAVTLCDTEVIMQRYYDDVMQLVRPSVVELPSGVYARPREPSAYPSSQILPEPAELEMRAAFARHTFINFSPTYVVTVSEEQPYRLEMHKPRPAPFRTRLINSFLREARHGSVRQSARVHTQE